MLANRFRVEINHHETIEKKVYYILKVTNLEAGTEKITKKRYSEIESMHQKITDWVGIFKIKIHIPSLPKKKLLFSTNQSEESILKRRQELQIYLNEILAYSELHCLDVIEQLLPKDSKQDKRSSERTETETKETRWNEINELKQSWLKRNDQKRNENPSFQLSMPQVNQQQSAQMKQQPYGQQYFFKFEEHYVMDDYLVYAILIRDSHINRSWKFNQRYKDLKEYHRLIKKSKKFDFDLPEFPEKKIVCQIEDEDLKERKQQLEAYLNKMFSYPEVAESEIMVFFIAKSQIDGNEIGCRSKGPSQATLENSSLKMKSQGTIDNPIDDVEPPSVKRKITC